MPTSARTFWFAALLGAALAAPSLAQSDHDRARAKAGRAAELSHQLPVAAVILGPSDGESLGVHVIQGGVYEPSIRPAESWLEIACVRDDLTVEYDRVKHGFSLVRVHAILYDRTGTEFLNTLDTSASDEGICSVDGTIDTTFIEFPRTKTVGRVLLAFTPRDDQNIEASEFTYRVFPR
ncbi:MAG: hypothetical protein OXC11_11130 [Rhodospirillales bacterium]|nr:hypothetical protein [Rhodospirillales bacterium]